jgi:uncharacterized protein
LNKASRHSAVKPKQWGKAMAAVSDLTEMIRGMEPVLAADPYGIAVCAAPVRGAFAVVNEAEGVTVIAPVQGLAAAGISVDAHWARISLTLHSALSAVGLTAAFARALADQGISANVVAGFHHDHIFVAWDDRDVAMAALRALARDA